MSAKDNFAQAFKELISGAAPEGKDKAIVPPQASEDIVPIIESEAADVVAAPVEQEQEPLIYQEPVQPQPTPVAAKPPVQEKRGFSPFSGFGGFGSQGNTSQGTTPPIPPTPPTTPPSFSSPFANLAPPVAGTTTIANGTVVIGEIHSKGDVNLYGEVKGNVETLGNVQLGGRVMGNVAGNDMVMSSSAVKGNVVADGSITVDDTSVVMGDLRAKDGEFDGKIKGNLQIEGLARFQGNTVLLGNVNVGSLIIEQGARLRGEICTGNREAFEIDDPFQG